MRNIPNGEGISEPVCQYRIRRSAEQSRRYRLAQQTDGAVRLHLRAGIEEFRALLEARYQSNDRLNTAA